MSSFRPVIRESTRLLWRSIPRRHVTTSSSSSSTTYSTAKWSRGITIGTLASLTLISSPFIFTSLHAETDIHPPTTLSQASLVSLLRTYLVYTLTSFPSIVDNSPYILSTLTRSSIPGVKPITELAIRETFFKQFVGGESVLDCESTMREMRERGVGTLLAYSVEVDEDGPHGREDGHGKVGGGNINQEEFKETIKAIEEAALFENKYGSGGGTWVAVKITGLVRDPDLLHRASNSLLRFRHQSSFSASITPTIDTQSIPYPGTSTSLDSQIVARPQPDTTSPSTFASFGTMVGPIGGGGVLKGEEGVRASDEQALRELWGCLRVIGESAKKSGIKIVIDAEHTWYQPALDAYTMMLSQEFNKLSDKEKGPSPLIYGTYQCYLTRTPSHIAASIAHAKANQYVLGLKLVRGAYHEQERKRWIKEGRIKSGPDPVWPDKPATDAAYDSALNVVISQLHEDIAAGRPPQLGVLFGTHNRQSVKLIFEQLKAKGLVKVSEGGKLRPVEGIRGRICVGQLYGMADELTETVAEGFVADGGVPLTLKYLPYGKLSEVLPYLGRRAVENKALLTGESGAAAERNRVVQEIKRRMGWSSQHKGDNVKKITV